MKNSRYLISVIIPAYNAEKFLVETLTSVFNQTYSNIEVIVVNDGSTDQTESLLFNIQKREPRLKFVSQQNQGISSARNAGIANAQGEYITFIDSDDKWDVTFLAKMVERQQQTNANIIYAGNSDWSSQGIKPRFSDFRENANLVGYLSQKALLHVGCLFIRKQFLDYHQVSFNTELKTGEDIVFICTLFCFSDAYSVPEYLYYYNHRDDSVMHRPWTKNDYLNDLAAWQRLENIINDSYQQPDRLEAISLIESKIVYYKLRLLWILLLAGKTKELNQLLDDGFLVYKTETLSLIPTKYAGIRRKIIESQSKLLWSLTRLIHRKKVNLV